MSLSPKNLCVRIAPDPMRPVMPEVVEVLPFVLDIKSDLSAYVIEKGVEGIIHYIAEEGAEIRKNPGRQVTTLLEKVFDVQ